MKIKFNSLKFEIGTLFTIIMGMVLIVYSGVLYFILASTLYIKLDNELKLKAQGINQSIMVYLEKKGDTPENLMQAIEKTIIYEGKHSRKWWLFGFERRWSKQVDELKLNNEYINFASIDGVSLRRSSNFSTGLLSIFSKNARASLKEQGQFKNIIYQKNRIRVFNLPFHYYKNKPQYVLQVGVSPQPIILLLQNWIYSIILSIPFILLLIYFVGQHLVLRILNPVEKVTTTAKKITFEDLSSRIQFNEYSYDEIRYLIDAFNEMISRLEKSFKHIEQFSSHVAHELKTPLTIMKGENELALLEERKSAEYKRVLQVNLEEIERILRIIEDLLFLAKLDYHSGILKFEKFNFTEFLNEIYNQSKLLAFNKRIILEMHPNSEPIILEGDKLHLRRLFFNLIDNAFKFTPEEGHVGLNVNRDKDKVVVTVSDTGRGIPSESLTKIFEKFFRSEGAESGVGLGLSIAQTIVKIHKGAIEVTSKVNQGSTFKVVLPLSQKLPS